MQCIIKTQQNIFYPLCNAIIIRDFKYGNDDKNNNINGW